MRLNTGCVKYILATFLSSYFAYFGLNLTAADLSFAEILSQAPFATSDLMFALMILELLALLLMIALILIIAIDPANRSTLWRRLGGWLRAKLELLFVKKNESTTNTRISTSPLRHLLWTMIGIASAVACVTVTYSWFTTLVNAATTAGRRQARYVQHSSFTRARLFLAFNSNPGKELDALNTTGDLRLLLLTKDTVFVFPACGSGAGRLGFAVPTKSVISIETEIVDPGLDKRPCPEH